MALVSRRGTTLRSKIAWTLVYWAISVAPLLLAAGYVYNWGGERSFGERQIARGVHYVFKDLPTPTPAPAPEPVQHHQKHHGKKRHAGASN